MSYEYCKIELTTKLRHPDQEVQYISDMQFDVHGTPLFSTTETKAMAYLFTVDQAYLVRRLLEVSPINDWRACNYAVVTP